MVDRCSVWESHADPAVRRISKPNPDPTYPAYAVGDTDSDNEATRVAVVTGQRSDQNQLEDLLRRVISTAEPPALKPEVLDAAKLLQQLVRETQSRPPGTDVTLFPRWTAPMTAAASATATYPTRLDRCGVFLLWGSRHMATRCPNLDEAFPFMQPAWRTEKTSGGFAMIPPQGTTDRRRAENGG